MIYFDFNTNILPTSSISYYEGVISFVNQWQNGQNKFIIKTSGSTGIPKEIEINRTQMIASAKLTITTFDLKKGNSLFCPINVSYIGGMMMVVRAIQLKAKLTVTDPIENPFLNEIGHINYDFAAFVPLQLQAILANSTTKNYLINKSGLKNIIIGGAAINETLSTEISKLPISCFSTYGMTETVSHIAICRLDGNNKGIFEVLKGINTDLDDNNCLKIRGDCTNQKWIQTNDIVSFIDKNHFSLIGRADNVINSGGVKIYLDTLEKEISSSIFQYFGDSTKYFLSGKSDEKLGQKLVLIIEHSKVELTIKDILPDLKLKKYHLPKELYFCDKFIETPTQKIDKKATLNILNIN